MGISLPSLSLRDGMVLLCFGVSSAEGSGGGVTELMVAVVQFLGELVVGGVGYWGC